MNETLPPSGPTTAPPIHTIEPSLPAAGPVLRSLFRTFLRTVSTRGRLAAVGALTAVSVLSAVAATIAGPTDTFEAGAAYAIANLTTLLPVAALVFGAGTLGDLIDDGSLVYIWLRPVSTRLPVVAAWATTVTIITPLVALPVLAGTLILDTTPRLIWATVIALVVGVLAYSAMAVASGVRMRRSLAWGLAYILLWEGFVASAGSTAGRLAVRSYLMSIIVQVAHHPIKLGRYTLASGILVPLVAGGLALVYTARRLARTDVP